MQELTRVSLMLVWFEGKGPFKQQADKAIDHDSIDHELDGHQTVERNRSLDIIEWVGVKVTRLSELKHLQLKH